MADDVQYEIVPELEQLLELQRQRDTAKNRLAATIREYHARGLSYRAIGKALKIDKSKVLRLVAQST